ncbi:Palmitoyl-protein_thioesterase [Hexamita inflata]|uniref:palmitoyl-CoA hydrolase n=1 Tax=Hexamita inflata TaxID=28002 RepID=A0AA86RVX5_9EUKA|nr:Palmitoyl-protein thioesterase [Hexamita inflata]
MLFLSGLVLQKQAPIVLIHGVMEDGDAMKDMQLIMQQQIPDLYVKVCDLGIGFEQSIFTSLDYQLEQLVICINNDPQLSSGFIGLGFSQGGLLLRGYLERYNHEKFPVLRFIGLSSPLAGEFCGVDSKCVFLLDFPDWLNELIFNVEFNKIFYDHFSIASYWRDPYNLDAYYQNGRYLLDLDNERTFNPQYKTNFMSVDKMILFGSESDGIIEPWQSAQFGFWKENSDSEVYSMEERDVYQLDLFGLKTMNEGGRIVLRKTHNNHLHNIHNKKFIVEELAPFVKMDVE